MQEKYSRSSRAKYMLKCHLIFAVKYRKKLLSWRIDEDIKQHLYDASNTMGFEIQTMESDVDHIHMMLSYKPKHSLTKIVNKLKQISTFRIWKQHWYALSKEFWKEQTFWSDGYFVCSIWDANDETVRSYIENQW